MHLVRDRLAHPGEFAAPADDDKGCVEVKLSDPVGVVEGGAADACARQRYGFEFGHGRDGAGATHLSANAQQTGGCFFGGVFQGDRPARSLLGEAGFVLKP